MTHEWKQRVVRIYDPDFHIIEIGESMAVIARRYLAKGHCVQAMRIGPYDNEPATIAAMDEFVRENGYANDFSEIRQHHEIYLSDARKVEPARRRTVIRHPVKKILCD